MGVRSVLVGIALVAIATLPMVSASAHHAEAPKSAAGGHPSDPATPTHRIAIIEGEVQAGQPFERPIGNGLRILLEPIASGWVLRVVPAQGPRGPHDYAELATPPYRSVSPLLIGTDFSFRAQDALAWNPRRFHFAADLVSFDELSASFQQYQRLTRDGPGAAAQTRLAEAHLAALASRSPEAELTFLDARLVQGTGDQTHSAALVASHPNGSARQVDQPTNGMATPLGSLEWLRFRIRLDLPANFHADRALRIDRAKSF